MNNIITKTALQINERMSRFLEGEIEKVAPKELMDDVKNPKTRDKEVFIALENFLIDNGYNYIVDNSQENKIIIRFMKGEEVIATDTIKITTGE